MKIFRVVSTDDHGESVFEAERLGNFQVEAFGVLLLDPVGDSVRVVVRCDTLVVRIWRFIEHGSKRGACVFDVEIELASEQRFMDKKAAAEICFTLDVYA